MAMAFQKVMKIFLVPLFVFGLFCSCKLKEVPHAEEIVIIFDNCPVQTTTSRFTGHLSQVSYATVSYINYSGELVQYEPRILGRDTLVIPAYNGYGELMHLYQAIEFDSYLLKAGDTVLVSYDENLRPELSSLMFKDYTEIYNLPYSFPNAIQSRGYYIETVLTNSQFTGPFRYFSNKQYQSKYPGLKDTFKDRFVDLDSLSHVFDSFLDHFKIAVDSLEQTGRIDGFYANYLKTLFIPSYRYSPEEVIQSDSLLHYISNFVRAQEYCQGDNPLTLFDKMSEDTLATELARKGILKRLLNRIVSGENGWHPYPEKVVEKYTSQYVNLTGDSLYIQKVEAIPVSVSDSSFDLLLEDKDGQVTTLANVLKQNKGKVIYVDFWASWCGPCRAEMPYSQELQKHFADKNVSFLFLSTDTNKEAWLNASNEEFKSSSLSYRILDRNATFLNELRLNSIPRYIVFDASGNLIDENAERPSSKEVKEYLGHLINLF